VEEGVEAKYSDDGSESIESDSPDFMDDSKILPNGWEGYEEAIEKEFRIQE
jgi:hypothetical protein